MRTKSFLQGCLITTFAFSLAVNYLYYTGVFQTVPQSEEAQLAAILAP